VSDTKPEDDINDKAMPLLDHLIELRTRLMWSIGTLVIAVAACYFVSTHIYSFLARPLVDILTAQSGEPRRLIFTALTEAFFTYLKVAFFGGAFLSFPVIAHQLWLFIAPGLYRSEKRALLPFLVASPVMFFLGAALAYYFVFPAAFKFFISFETPPGSGGVPIQLEAKVGEYLDLVMKLIFAFGIAFQMPVALSLMAKVGIVSSKGLKKARRYAIVGIFVAAAILTPPDPMSQIGLALPLMALYELSIIAARFVEPKPPPDEDATTT
jgi:sec-independent protein translocase protein TatC